MTTLLIKKFDDDYYYLTHKKIKSNLGLCLCGPVVESIVEQIIT